jgi:hypothetical protein
MKKTLFGLLARREAERLGCVATEAEVEAFVQGWREAFGLADDEGFASFLAERGTTPEAAREILRDLLAVTQLERSFAGPVAERLTAHIAIQSARGRR